MANKKIVIEYDINGKPIDVAVDKTLNLKRQVVELTKALRSAREGSDEFKLLSSRLSDTQDKLANTTAKSKDLFGSLSLLPGPIGQFASGIQQGIELLKVFSSFTFKDIQFQFKETANDIADIGKNFVGVNTDIEDVGNTSKEASTKIDDIAKSAENASSNLAGASVQSENLTKALDNQNRILYQSSDLFKSLSIEDQKLINNLDDLSEKYGLFFGVSAEGEATVKNLAGETRILAESEILAIQSGEALTLTTEGLVAVEKQATFWTSTLGKTIKGVLIGTGIGLAIVLIGELVSWIYKLVTAETEAEAKTRELKEAFGKNAQAASEARNRIEQVGVAFEQARKGTISKREALDEYNKVLGGTIGQAETLEEAEKLYNANTGNYIKAVGLRAEAQELYALAAKKSAEALTAEEVGFWSFDRKLFQSFEDELRERKKKLNSTADEFRKKGNELTAEALKLEKLYKPKEEKKAGGKTALELANEERNRRLKELDALIKLEIDKEKTSGEQLEKYLKEKLEIRQKLEKLSLAERKVIIAENAKITLEAIIEDNQRVIQGEIDKYTRLGITSGILTKEYFEARRNQARQELQRDLVEADKDAKTKETKVANANIAFFKKLTDIEREQLEARVAFSQLQSDNEYEGTVKFFNKQRELEDSKYALAQAAARDNYEKLEELRRQHERNLIAIDVAEIKYKAGLEEKKATTEQENYTKVEDRFIESFKTIKQLNERKYEDLRNSEKLNYEAEVKAAGDNTALVEQITREHNAKMNQLNAEEFENRKQTLLMIEKTTEQFGQTISQIGNLIMEQAKGRDEAMFKAGKAAAIAGIAIEKAAAIASIWTNNAIANAKAVAAFPLTAGQPWVTINTVSAALSTAATIAAAVQAISQINNTQFNDTSAATGGEAYNGLGRNYGDGGMIDGPRHAQGGVMINAEGGEAVMTRGAVTMFQPLLSMMNQMGGGTSFSKGAVGQASFDNPKVANPVQDQQLIVKTYVVSQDMTSDQQKQARLKDLSTL